GFGEPLAPHDVTAQDRMEVGRLLGVAGALDQGRAGVAETDEAGVDARESLAPVLLEPDQRLDQRQPTSSVLGRPGDAGPAGVVLLSQPRRVEVADALAVVRSRLAGLVLGEPRADLVAELALVVGEREVHVSSSPGQIAFLPSLSDRG